MSYSTTNPPMKIAQGLGAAPSLWVYVSTDDDSSTNAASYYSNAIALGMKLGDFVLVRDTTTPKGSFHYVASVTATAATTAFGAVA